ncbi:MAG: DNA methyltransferase [Bacteroidota bacterium]
MQNLQNDLIELLKQEDSLVIDGQLNKNKIVEMALQVDPKLIKLLLQHSTFKNHFFTDVEGVIVFDKIKFQRFVNNKSFLPDSYTAFKNKIGLTINDGTTDNYINTNNDVVLAWPHKDCVLEGGQTKEDQKRNEIFWNETLAPDEVDRLLDPKVLTNWKKYDEDGEHEATEITDDDNLIIKGNNLLALSSIAKRKEIKGNVKLIYIDPPYNTGSDSFQYNDSFIHSSWLTFTKNRLIQAKKLLRKDGAIFVHIDHHQLGYLNVLMDEVFGASNKVQVISIKTASPAGFKTVNPGPIDVTEYILFYTNNKTQFKFRKNYVPVGYNSNYNLYLERNDDIKEWKFIPIKQKVIETAGFADEKEARKKYGKLWNSIVKVMIEDFAYENADNVVSIRDPHKPTEKVKKLMEESKTCDYVIPYKREDGSVMYLYKGGSLAFYSKKMIELDGKYEITELLTDFWNHISWAGIAKEGGVKLKNGKKPEKLLKQIFEIATNKGDIVLDYHLGSGTTCAVAHKMGLRYIGIEQLDYEKDDSVVRLKNVINNDQSGISKAVNWQGGGSFIYCELAKFNQSFVDEILEADNNEKLLAVWHEMKEKALLSYQFDKHTFDERIEAFKTLSLDDQKKFLLEVLDKNQLHVNYSEINDETYNISEADKKLNKQFYNSL